MPVSPKVPMVAGQPYGALTVSPKDDGTVTIVQPHPSNPTSTLGYIVANVAYAKREADLIIGGWEPTPESMAYAQLFAAAPKLAAFAQQEVQQYFANGAEGSDARFEEMTGLMTLLIDLGLTIDVKQANDECPKCSAVGRGPLCKTHRD